MGYVQSVTDPRGIVTETTYDMLGQVLQSIDVINPEIEGSAPSTRSFNAQNQTSSVSFGIAPTYDNNGNTISDNGQTLVYDAWNRLVAAKSGSTTVAAYGYDALGRRISETYSVSSTTNYLYYSPQWQVIEERQNGTGTSNVSQQYVWGAAYIDQMISRDTYTSGSISSTLFVLQDANWNVTALTDSSGNIVERYLYDPYGDVTVLSANWVPVSGNVSAFGWRYLHQGGRLYPVTGWYDFRNRDYIPSEGRRAERDPMGFGGGSANLYNYVGSSPVNSQDPMGLWTLDGYGNYMNDLTGGLYNWIGTNVFAPAITSVTGVSGLANATDNQLIIGTAGVTTIAVAGVVAAPAIASGLSSATAAVTSAATSVGAAAVAYGGTAVEAAAINAELTVGIGYSAYEILNSTYQGKMSIGEAVVNGLMTWLSYGAPGLRLPGTGIPTAKPVDSGRSDGCQAGIASIIGRDTRTITPYWDPARPGYNNGLTQIDHAQARSLGGTNEQSNLRPLAAETNLRKGGYEGELKAYLQYLIRNGMSPQDASAVIQPEIDALRVSPPPRPMNPRVLDQLPANPLDQGRPRCVGRMISQ